MIDAALAERADELMDAVCDGRIPTRAELKLKVRALLAVCANEALEKAAREVELTNFDKAGAEWAAAIRKLKAEG